MCGVESEVNVSDVRVQRACFIVEQLECGTVCSLNKCICNIIEEIKPRQHDLLFHGLDGPRILLPTKNRITLLSHWA